MATADTAPPSAEEPSLPARFFRFFQHEITALQEQIEHLSDRPTVGGERADAAEHCLAGISRLSSEVKDASVYLPAYDQRTYAEAVKALQEKLQETKAAFAPRSKFSFKARKSPSAISLSDAAELAAQKRKAVPGYLSPHSNTTPNTSLSATPAHLQTPPNEQSSTTTNYPVPVPVPAHPAPSNTQSTTTTPQRPTLSQSPTSVSISSQTNAHIILPSTSSLSPGTPCVLSRLSSCVLDLLSPTTNPTLNPINPTATSTTTPTTTTLPPPFASLTLTSTSTSLLLLGRISGPAHITHLTNSVIVLSVRQLRMHHCSNVSVYLHCTSRPIIEDCVGIRFTFLPDTYKELLVGNDVTGEDRGEGDGGGDREGGNMYSQVDDFKHLKSSPSPNWEVMKQVDRIPEDTWREDVPGGPGWSVDDILRRVGVK